MEINKSNYHEIDKLTDIARGSDISNQIIKGVLAFFGVSPTRYDLLNTKVQLKNVVNETIGKLNKVLSNNAVFRNEFLTAVSNHNQQLMDSMLASSGFGSAKQQFQRLIKANNENLTKFEADNAKRTDTISKLMDKINQINNYELSAGNVQQITKFLVKEGLATATIPDDKLENIAWAVTKGVAGGLFGNRYDTPGQSTGISSIQSSDENFKNLDYINQIGAKKNEK